MMASAGQGGRLVYVMGPSGAGKDSILHYAALRLADDVRFSFPRRWITRPADSGAEPGICRISNDGGLAEAGEAFLALLRRLPGKMAAVSSPG